MKLTLLSTENKIEGHYSREIMGIFPQVGWAEQDPDQWYHLLCAMLQDIFAENKIKPEEIIAIAPDAATHTTVLLDENFRPVRPAIMWNDQRAASIASEFSPSERAEIIETTLHPPGAMWSLCQNLWVKKYEPKIWKKVKYILFAKDYLRFRLTGEYVTDAIDAQGSQFYDVGGRCWSKRLCKLMEFEPDHLPMIQKPTDGAGSVTPKAAAQTGFAAGTKVITGTSDTVMEVLAAGAIEIGQSTIKLATSGRICIVTDRAYPHPQLVNYSHVIDGLWYPGTGTRSCATSLRWFKDNFAQYEQLAARERDISVYKILDEMAEKIPAGSEGLFYHPYLLGEFTPYSNANLRASFIGAGMKHTKAHFVRAILEGTAYSLKDCMAVLDGLNIQTKGNIKLIGGGSISKLWGQIVADILNKEVEVPHTSDSSFGSALLAAVGARHFSSFGEAVDHCVKNSAIIKPNEENAKIYHQFFGVYKDIVQSLTNSYDKIAEILKTE